MPRLIKIKTLTLVWFLFPVCLMAAKPGGGDVILTPAEKEFVALADEFNSELNKFWKQTRERTDAREAEAYVAEHNPATEYLPKLLSFESAHAGEDIGLDALGEVVAYAARGGGRESPGVLARREVLPRLGAYEERELAIGAIYGLTRGNYDPSVVDYLRRLAVSQKAHPTVRETGRFMLAKELLTLRDARLVCEQRFQALVEGGEPTMANEAQLNRDYLRSLPSAGDIASGIDEAMAILEELAASGESFRLPVIRTLDPTGRIARIDPEQSKSATCLSERAAALLFKEQHLRVGRPAPELELKLVDGELWSLASQRGRVVVIQFSFTGCGPCERMYPDLRKLHEEYPEQLSIISIMSDETQVSSIEAIKAGKITWSVALDGKPGRVASRWAVEGFPDVYVIDQEGRVAAVNLRGEKLKAKVAELIGAQR